jgi:2-dehydro-3-deoxyphosphooctonate aldolase (KDO 8-P synthase)
VDGLFLEVHPEPARARSDKGSQWPLAELEGLLQSLMKIHQSIADTVLVKGGRS